MPATPSDCPGIEHCAEAEPIHDQLQTLQSSVRILAQGHATLAEKMAEVTMTLRRQDERIDSNAEVLSSLQASSLGNAEMLRDIKDIVTAGRVTWRVSKAVGSFIKWGAGLVIAVSGAWFAITHGPKP